MRKFGGKWYNMGMEYIYVLVLLVVAFVWALRSATDMEFGKQIEGFIETKKAKGSILFLKDKIVHYSSSSSSPSSL